MERSPERKTNGDALPEREPAGAAEAARTLRRFFVPPEDAGEDTVYFRGDLARHMGGVLRMRPGMRVAACTGDGAVRLVELERFGREEIAGRVVACSAQQPDAAVQVTLYQGMPKGDKLEQIIQKCTELGVYALFPVQTQRSVARLAEERAAKKTARWQKIAREASQQARRLQVPQIGPCLSWQELLQCLERRAAAGELCVVLWEEETALGLRTLLRGTPAPRAVSLLVGPEGGLAPEEVAQLRKLGVRSAGLGPRILRTETAGPAALAMLLYEYGDLG